MKDYSFMLNHIFPLVESICITSKDYGIHINNTLNKNPAVNIPENTPKEEWKYYMNLAGEYHFTNKDIFVYVPEIDEERKMTLQLLEDYPSIRKNLLKFDIEYKELTNKYPDQISLIRGLMLPADKKKAIEARCGTIVTYNDKLVEENEKSLIGDVEGFIINMFKTWFNSLFIYTDNKFVEAHISGIYTKLPMFIFNHRLSKVFTFEAHSYHVNEFFKSNRRLDEDVDVLRPDIKMWLYKNLRYLLTHSGKQETLLTVIDKILTPNGIGVGEIKLIEKELEVDSALYQNNDKLFYDDNRQQFISKAVNTNFVLNKDKVRDLSTLLKDELESQTLSPILGDTYEYRYNELAKMLKLNNSNDKKTKVLEIDRTGSYSLQTIPELLLILDNWFANADKMDYVKEFTDRNTNITYKITSAQARLMLIKLFAVRTGQDNPLLDKFVCFTSLDSSITRSDLVKGCLDADMLSNVIQSLLDIRPSNVKKFDNEEQTKEYINDIHKFTTLAWQLIANINNGVLSAGIKVVYKRLLKTKEIDFKVDGQALPINTLLEKEGINFNITNKYDYSLTIKDLVKTFTGLSIDSAELVEEGISKYINIVKKLSSYSIHFIHEKTSSSRLEVGYTYFNTISTKETILKIDGKEFLELEKFKRGITFYADNKVIKPITREMTNIAISFEDSREKVPVIATNVNLSKPTARQKIKPFIAFGDDNKLVKLAKTKTKAPISGLKIPKPRFKVGKNPISVTRDNSDSDKGINMTRV